MSAEVKTLNEVLSDLAELGKTPVKIASGYYLTWNETYLLCKCDGNGVMGLTTCPSCEQEIIVCTFCLERRLITHCSKCNSLVGRVTRLIEQLNTPIDFDELISAGMLERVTATRYRVLVNIHDLPQHVVRQATGIEQITRGGKLVETIIEFDS